MVTLLILTVARPVSRPFASKSHNKTEVDIRG
jgi:hypothetical protein